MSIRFRGGGWESAEVEVMPGVGRGDGADVSGGGFEGCHLPGGGVVVVETQQLGRDAGAECDFEAVEGSADAFSGGFDDGFFAGPAFEEGLVLQLGGKAGEMGLFGGREEVLGDGVEFGVRHGAVVLDVESDGGGGNGASEDGLLWTPGVAGVEVELGVGREEGFAALGVSEMELRGEDFKIGGEDAAEAGAAEDVEVAEVVVVEAVCAGEFVG